MINGTSPKILEMYKKMSESSKIYSANPSDGVQNKDAQTNKLERQPTKDSFIINIKNNYNKLSDTEKYSINTGAGTIVIAASIYLVKRAFKIPPSITTGIKQYAQNIEFKTASSLEEAIEYAQKNWGIKEFEITNLDIANWVNLNITKISNKLNGKLAVPHIINYTTPQKNKYAVSINPEQDTIFINKEYYENIGTTLSSLVEALKKGNVIVLNNETSKTEFRRIFVSKDIEKANNLLEKYTQNPDNINYNQQIELLEACSAVNNKCKTWKLAPLNILKQILKSKEVLSGLKDTNIETDINKISNMCTQEQADVLKSIFMKFKIDAFTFETNIGSSGSSIFHEFGHLQHYYTINNGMEFYKLAKKDECEEIFGKISDETKEFLENSEIQQNAARVTEYATCSPLEFVAETFSKLIDGNNYPKEVMDLYYKYKGPKISLN